MSTVERMPIQGRRTHAVSAPQRKSLARVVVRAAPAFALVVAIASGCASSQSSSTFVGRDRLQTNAISGDSVADRIVGYATPISDIAVPIPPDRALGWVPGPADYVFGGLLSFGAIVVVGPSNSQTVAAVKYTDEWGHAAFYAPASVGDPLRVHVGHLLYPGAVLLRAGTEYPVVAVTTDACVVSYQLCSYQTNVVVPVNNVQIQTIAEREKALLGAALRRQAEAAEREKRRKEQEAQLAARQQRARAESQRVAEQQRQNAERVARIEADQRARGLVKYKGEWLAVDEARKREREDAYEKKAADLVQWKSRPRCAYRILQPLSEQGALCYSVGSVDDVFLIVGEIGRLGAEGDQFIDTLYWCGTWKYITRANIPRTVNTYAYDPITARRIVRSKFGLYDKEGSGEIASQGEGAQPSAPSSEAVGSGSGFVIASNGYMLTNEHVVRGASRVEAMVGGARLAARVVASDPRRDLAVLKVDAELDPVSFTAVPVARPGQAVFTCGFPMPGLLGRTPRTTRGIISSVTGLNDDDSVYQIDAAVQPGNSGGPVADEQGNIVGVVSSKLSDFAAIGTAGSIAQNVNFCIKRSEVMAFLSSHPEIRGIAIARDVDALTPEDAVAKVVKSTVMVVIY